MNLKDLTDSQKIELYTYIKKTYPWCTKPLGLRVLASNIIKTGEYKPTNQQINLQ